MRKLIETNQKYLVVCDNPKCDYTVPYTEESAKLISQYIDKPCPECGDNLLTREDYHKYNKIMSIINFLNRWFSWLTVLTLKYQALWLNPEQHQLAKRRLCQSY